ncbi:MAG: hypothetical protein Q7R52_02345 [archaeon]|nr:hypothetical protein [archaeon]
MEKSTIIHVKFEREEAIQSKKDILSAEINLINLIKIIKKYQIYRMEELKLKTVLKRDINYAVQDIKKIEELMPEAKRPTIIRKKEDKFEEKVRIKENQYSNELESQLTDIQNKLNSLEGR